MLTCLILKGHIVLKVFKENFPFKAVEFSGNWLKSGLCFLVVGLSLGLILLFSVQFAPNSYFLWVKLVHSLFHPAGSHVAATLALQAPGLKPHQMHTEVLGTHGCCGTQGVRLEIWALAGPYLVLTLSSALAFSARALCKQVKSHYQLCPAQPPKMFFTLTAQPSSGSSQRQRTPALPEVTVASGHLHTWASPAASPEGQSNAHSPGRRVPSCSIFNTSKPVEHLLS